MVLPSWDYFIAENIPYHGHNITVLYDRDGSRYQAGSGMRIFVDGELSGQQNGVGPMQVTIPSPITHPNGDGTTKMENYAANVDGFGYPMVDASFTSIDASVWHVVDGRIFYDHIPTNRWTNFDSRNPTDWFSLDFGPGRYRTVSQIKLYVYSDVATGEGEVDCFKSITVEYFDGQNWVPVQNQRSTPPECVNNDVNIVEFTPITTRMLRVVFARDEVRNHFIGLTEMEVWSAWPQTNDRSYEAEDGWLNDADIRESATASAGAYVGRINDDSAFVEFTGVWVETRDEYNIQAYYANGESDATMNVRINNIHSTVVTFPTTGRWGNFSQDNCVTFKASLLRGNNVLIFQHGSNFVELDKMSIIVPDDELPSTPSMPSTPSRSERVALSFNGWLNVIAIAFTFTLWM